jgi:hypothetical protein
VRVVVTGAPGFVCQAVVPALRGRGSRRLAYTFVVLLLWPIFDSLILKALVIQSVGSAAGV